MAVHAEAVGHELFLKGGGVYEQHVDVAVLALSLIHILWKKGVPCGGSLFLCVEGGGEGERGRETF